MKKIRFLIKIIFIFLTFSIFYTFIRANFLKYEFENLLKSTHIYVTAYTDRISISKTSSNIFSFYRAPIFPDFLYLDLVSIGLAERFLHIPRNYNICFENIPHAFPLYEERNCEWFDCSGYVVRTQGINPEENNWLGNSNTVKETTIEEIYNNFSKISEIKKAKITTDKSCKNYNEVSELFEYDVMYYVHEGSYYKELNQ